MYQPSPPFWEINNRQHDCAYYSRGCDAKELFSPYKIARNLDFDTYRNKYNTLFLNMQEFLSRTKNIYELLDRMKRLVLRDLKREYPNVDYFDDTDLIESMQDVYQETNCPFVVIIENGTVFSGIQTG